MLRLHSVGWDVPKSYFTRGKSHSAASAKEQRAGIYLGGQREEEEFGRGK